MPNALLARYFQARGLFNDLDFAAMKEGKPDVLFEAWLNLMEGQRNAMDAELLDIFEMSCEKGFRAIIDEAEFQLDEDDFTAWVEKLVCDKRSDINRVAIPLTRLTQWQCSTAAVCGFVAATLGLRRSDEQSALAALWNIGVATGDKRSQMLCLQADSTLALVAGNNSMALAEMVEYHDGGKGLAADKMAALEAAGVVVAKSPAGLGEAMVEAVARKGK